MATSELTGGRASKQEGQVLKMLTENINYSLECKTLIITVINITIPETVFSLLFFSVRYNNQNN